MKRNFILFNSDLVKKIKNLFFFSKSEGELGPSEVIKLCLTSGFYFNSARKIHNQEYMYLLIYPEGSIVDIDSNSVFSLTETFPDCVIYTELGGSV